MCGIAGIVSLEPEGEVLVEHVKRMLSALRHRGPDDLGVHLSPDGRACLGHVRLSIIDLAGGHQPLSNETGTLWVTYNGESYDFASVRSELERRGHVFRTRTDTEVVAHLYEDRGLRLTEGLRGMFALGLWDERDRQLVLVRDRLGKKPLVYCQKGPRLAFASELGALMELPWVHRELDLKALDQYLTYQYVPHPLTMLKGIKKLPPGSLAVWKDGRLTLESYWTPQPKQDPSMGMEEAAEELRARFHESVRLRLVSDVPVGAFLSGGLDSSIVVAVMAQESTTPVRTFSIGFQEEEYSEVRFSRMVAKHLGTTHEELIVTPKSLEILPRLITHYGEPFGDSSAIPTFYLSEMTSRHVKVCLSGDGGDELFLGYPRYRAVALAQIYDHLPGLLKRGSQWIQSGLPEVSSTWPRRARRFLRWLGAPDLERYARWVCIFDPEAKSQLYAPEVSRKLREPAEDWLQEIFDRAPDLDPVARVAYVDLLSYLPCDILTKVDIASMSSSLECRCPFLDHPLVEFALRVPTRFKMRHLRSKLLLKRTFGPLLPAPVLQRAKMGFGVPVSRWFKAELAGAVREVLTDERCLSRGLFRPESLLRLLDEHQRGVRDHGYRLWSLLVLETWMKTTLD